MTNDSVDIAFQLMMDELEKKSNDLNAEGAALFRNSDYLGAAAKANTGEALLDFKKRVSFLREEWQKHYAETFPTTESREIENIARTIASASKSSKTILAIKFPDGETIYEDVAADSFTKALQKIGLNQIADLNIPINRESLVSRKRPTGYSTFKEIDGFFIITHSSTDQKRELLEKIAQKCNISLSVNIVPSQQ